MPKFSVEWSQEAENDLDEIRDYLVEQNPWAAIRFESELDKSLWPLQKWPRFYPVYRYAKKYRKIVVGAAGYIVLYRVQEEQRVVVVERLLHGARNIRALLQEAT